MNSLRHLFLYLFLAFSVYDLSHHESRLHWHLWHQKVLFRDGNKPERFIIMAISYLVDSLCFSLLLVFSVCQESHLPSDLVSCASLSVVCEDAALVSVQYSKHTQRLPETRFQLVCIQIDTHALYSVIDILSISGLSKSWRSFYLATLVLVLRTARACLWDLQKERKKEIVQPQFCFFLNLKKKESIPG